MKYWRTFILECFFAFKQRTKTYYIAMFGLGFSCLLIYSCASRSLTTNMDKVLTMFPSWVQHVAYVDFKSVKGYDAFRYVYLNNAYVKSLRDKLEQLPDLNILQQLNSVSVGFDSYSDEGFPNNLVLFAKFSDTSALFLDALRDSFKGNFSRVMRDKWNVFQFESNGYYPYAYAFILNDYLVIALLSDEQQLLSLLNNVNPLIEKKSMANYTHSFSKQGIIWSVFSNESSVKKRIAWLKKFNNALEMDANHLAQKIDAFLVNVYTEVENKQTKFKLEIDFIFKEDGQADVFKFLSKLKNFIILILPIHGMDFQEDSVIVENNEKSVRLTIDLNQIQMTQMLRWLPNVEDENVSN